MCIRIWGFLPSRSSVWPNAYSINPGLSGWTRHHGQPYPEIVILPWPPTAEVELVDRMCWAGSEQQGWFRCNYHTVLSGKPLSHYINLWYGLFPHTYSHDMNACFWPARTPHLPTLCVGPVLWGQLPNLWMLTTQRSSKLSSRSSLLSLT